MTAAQELRRDQEIVTSRSIAELAREDLVLFYQTHCKLLSVAKGHLKFPICIFNLVPYCRLTCKQFLFILLRLFT